MGWEEGKGGGHHRQAVTDQLWMLRVIFLLTLEIIVIIAVMIMHEESEIRGDLNFGIVINIF